MAHPRLWAAVGLGVLLRLVHYLRRPAVWHDEAAVMVNILRKNFAELLGPLDHTQAAPPLFLWLQRLSALGFGDGESVLRFWPLAFGCLAVVFVALAARRLLDGPAAFWAVLLMAVSDRLLWHACECKPYSIDVCVAALGVWLYVRRDGRPTWGLAAFPLLMALSYTACFVLGGLMLAWLPRLRREHYGRFVVTAGVAVLVFTWLTFGPIRSQRSGELQTFWATFFPDWSRWWGVPAWAVRSALGVAHYDIMPVGSALAALAAAGGVTWWRGGRRGSVVALAAPAALALLAACLHRYPFGGGRLMAFTAPALCLLVGAGVGPTSAWLRRFGPARRLLPLLLLAPAVVAAYRVAVPWPRAGGDAAAAFVAAHRRPGDAVAYNHWDYEYYFRGAAGDVRYWRGGPLPAGRLWLVVTSKNPADRDALIRAAGGRIARRASFRFTDVVLLTGGR